MFIHGLGAASTADYPHIATHPALAGRRSLLVDLLGFGFSDRPQDLGYSIEDYARALADLLDGLGVRQCELIGHSMGGSVAITLASNRPDLVGRLVVAEANLDAGGGWLSRSIAEQSEVDYVRWGHQELVEEMQRRAPTSYSWAGAGFQAGAGALQGGDPALFGKSIAERVPTSRAGPRRRRAGGLPRVRV